MTTYEKMVEKSKDLEKQIESAKKQLTKCPAGKLVCAKNGNGIKWYNCSAAKPVYIYKKDRHFAEQLAKRKYLELQIKELKKEKHAMDLFLKHSTKDIYKHRELLYLPGYEELLSPYFQSTSQNIKNWIDTPYDTNPFHPENLIHNIGFGQKVRSKSEMMIARILTEKGIPFRYECALHLGHNTYYPDFTLLRPSDEKILYWEHFGLMDVPEYRQNAYAKLKIYNEYGIYQDIDLITTFETQFHSLDYDNIESKIQMLLY